jgi:hypothetical protein
MTTEKYMAIIEWVTNEHKDYRPHLHETEEGWLVATQSYEDWAKRRSQFVVGRPNPPPGSPYTIEQMEGLGYIGLYQRL